MPTSNSFREAEISSIAGLAYHEYPPDYYNGWKRIAAVTLNSSGFSAVAYKKGDDIIIAYRGTDGLVGDISADLSFVSGTWHQQFSDAAKFTNDIKNSNKNSNIFVTGHSLGGGIGQLMSKMFDLPGITFEAVGAKSVSLTREFYENAKFFNQDPDRNNTATVVNYRIEGSVVSGLRDFVGEVKSIANLTDPSVVPFMAGLAFTAVGTPFLGIFFSEIAANLMSKHPLEAMQRSLWSTAALEAALNSGELKIVKIRIDAVSGNPVKDGSPNSLQAQAFADANGKLLAIVRSDNGKWTISTLDKSTVITLTPGVAEGDPLRCSLAEKGKAIITCAMIIDRKGNSKISYDTDGDNIFDRVIESKIDENGSVVERTSNLTVAGGLKNSTIVTTSADGLTTVTVRDRNGDEISDQVVMNSVDERGNTSYSSRSELSKDVLEKLSYTTNIDTNISDILFDSGNGKVQRSFIIGEVTQSVIDNIRNQTASDFRKSDTPSSLINSTVLNSNNIKAIASDFLNQFNTSRLDSYLLNVNLASSEEPSTYLSIPKLPELEKTLLNELSSFINLGRVDSFLGSKGELIITSERRKVIVSVDGTIQRHYFSEKLGEVVEEADSNGELRFRKNFVPNNSGTANSFDNVVTNTEYFQKGVMYAQLQTLNPTSMQSQSILSLSSGKDSLVAEYIQGRLRSIVSMNIDGREITSAAAKDLAVKLNELRADDLRLAYKSQLSSVANSDNALDSSQSQIYINAIQKFKGELVAVTDYYGKPQYTTSKDLSKQTLSQGVSSLIDALSLVRAIQSGQPLPIVATGLRLAAGIDFLDGTRDLPNLGAAAGVAGAVLSLYGLADAIKRNDTVGALSSASYAVYGAAEAAKFLQSSGMLSQTPTALNAAGNAIGEALPYINLVNSIAHGDQTGTAIAVVDIVMTKIIGAYTVPVLGWAYAIYSIVDSLTTDTPSPWGHARFVWDGSQLSIDAAGEVGGKESVQSAMQGVLASLNALIVRQQQQNPGSQLGIIASRMPSLSYGMDGYHYTAIDENTGLEKNPALRFDTTGRPYNAELGSPQSYQSLIEAMIRSALAREAVAPTWEVETARLQTLAGDPRAGLREEERAGRDGKLAPAVTGVTVATQIFRPVVLDLDADGIEITSRADGVVFDVDNSGYKKQTSWINADDGFLTLDRNYNGLVDTGREMFSNSAVALSLRGLKGMAWMDANYDGRINTSDPVWNELRIWRDLNKNGSQDQDELQTLNQLNITDLNYAMGTYTRNGQVAQMASPDLEADTQGLRLNVMPQGILVEASENGKLSLLVTRIDDKTAVEANRDGVNGIEDVELIINSADLVANDELGGFKGRHLSVVGLTNFQHGKAWLDTNGFVHFQGDANYDGKEAGFSYVVKADNGQTAIAQVDISLDPVNDAPTLSKVEKFTRQVYGYQPLVHTNISDNGFAGDVQYEGGGEPVYVPFYEFQPQSETVIYRSVPIADEFTGRGKILGADVDDASDGLKYESVNQPQYGSVTVNETGEFNYTSWKAPGVVSDHFVVNGEYAAIKDGYVYSNLNLPPQAIIPKVDTFQVRITDAHGASSMASIDVPHFGPYLPPMPQGGGKKPIAIDLNGNGFEFTNLDDSNIFFDVTGDGWKRRTSWIGKNDGLLAYDIDGDGKIDKPGEISFTSYKDGAQTDLEGMKAFDTNHDGIFDAKDEKWARFGIWRDANQNGIADAGELRSLADFGVRAIHLESDGKFSVVNGQTVHGIGVIDLQNGTQLAMADVTLAYSQQRQITNGSNTSIVTPISPFSKPWQVSDGGAGKDLILGKNGNDVINGSDGDDVILDDGGNDLIDSGNGNDQVFSGADNDFIKAGNGDDVVYAGKGNDLIFGQAGKDVLFGEDGQDIIFGGADDDFIAGGNGDDVISGEDGNDQLYGEAGNDALFGGKGNDALYGLDGGDSLDGGEGDDVLDGGLDADQMTGGKGNDDYVVDNTSDTVLELKNEGIDTVHTNLDRYELSENLENLIFSSTAKQDSGKTGIGNSLDNTLTGATGNDELVGYAGNDVLDGGKGADLLVGGEGNDTYIVDNADDVVLELNNDGIDLIKSSVSFTLSKNVENLVLTGSENTNATGNDGVNIIQGNSGNNRIDGGKGADIMAGGLGNDIYVVDNNADVISENNNEGNDTVIASVSFNLTNNVENLSLTGSENLTGSGNALNNVISGNAGKNLLQGGVGDDVLVGNKGDDTLDGGIGNDTYIYNLGDGLDRIVDIAGSDIVRFGEGLTLDKLALRTVSTAAGIQAQIRVLDAQGEEIPNQGINFSVTTDQRGQVISPIEQFIFSDGSALHFDDLQIKLQLLKMSYRQTSATGDRNDDIILGNRLKNNIVTGNGRDVVFAGAGSDIISTGAGNDFIAAGSGDDQINVGSGKNIIAFNDGDGRDTLFADAYSENTLSLGGGIKLKDLSLRHVGNDLIIDIGRSDRITWRDWYLNSANHNDQTLQIISETTKNCDTVYQAEKYNFSELVSNFDSKNSNSATKSSWSLMQAALDAHLVGDQMAALGGELSFDYAANGNMTLSQTGVGEVIRQPNFASIEQQRLQTTNKSYYA